METILAIDYGKSKVGLAISSGKLADPLMVIKYKDIDDLLAKIKKIATEELAQKLVIGISEGQSAKDATAFGKTLSEYLGLPVVFVDETLSTFDAQDKAIASGMKQKRRKLMEDAFAAAVILQSYLDNQ